ncbi:MAG: LysR family transcriptional regulator [Bacteroidales bacterium]|nr:LysR family transcriptional regulator [Bacteroidales bacterium]
MPKIVTSMTLQQLEYIVALDEQRHFARAAEVCKITQSTLSLMIRKLEEELDITIFDRKMHPIKPTLAGESLIRQARIVLFHSKQLLKLTQNERQKSSGEIRLGITSTIAPYIMPKFFKYINNFTDIKLIVKEMYNCDIVGKLKSAEIDMAIMSNPEKNSELLEIPLYNEKLFAYVSPNDPLSKNGSIDLEKSPSKKLWPLKQSICFKNQIDGLSTYSNIERNIYETGNISTLLQIVDENDGFTVLPELHIPLLCDETKKNLRPIAEPVPTRTVSLFVRADYMRENLINIVIDGIKSIIPENMINDRLKKYRIKL